ncbi:2OG-Fe(II) oxygenase superfamily protein [Hirsutella rhossiliensis]
MSDFTEIPILDLSLAASSLTKPQLLSELQFCLVHVGFFYIKGHSISDELQRETRLQSEAFFNLPVEQKLKVETLHSKHFLGYSSMSTEFTGGTADFSEAFTIGPDLPAPGLNQPIYYNLAGPSQWPDESTLPGFRQILENYRTVVQNLSAEFAILIAEALDIEPSSLTTLLGQSPCNQLCLRKYPSPLQQTGSEICQGMGAHKDQGFMTFLLQLDKHQCLEIQNKSGTWIQAPPIPGTLVVNVGHTLELLTQGVCTATTHRVTLRPENFVDSNGLSLGPRFSIAYFQDVDTHLKPADLTVAVPSHVASLVEGEKVISDAAEVSSGLFDHSVGDKRFAASLRCFTEVGQRWYSDLM